MDTAQVTNALLQVNPLALAGSFIGNAWYGCASHGALNVHVIVTPDSDAMTKEAKRAKKPSGAKRGRPKGSRNKAKEAPSAASKPTATKRKRRAKAQPAPDTSVSATPDASDASASASVDPFAAVGSLAGTSG